MSQPQEKFLLIICITRIKNTPIIPLLVLVPGCSSVSDNALHGPHAAVVRTAAVARLRHRRPAGHEHRRHQQVMRGRFK